MEIFNPKKPEISKSVEVNSEKVVKFNGDDVEALKLFLKINKYFCSMLCGGEGVFDAVLNMRIERIENGLTEFNLTEEEKTKLRNFAMKIEEINKSLSIDCVCRFVSAPDKDSDISQSILETGGVGLDNYKNGRNVINARNDYADDLLTGAKYQFDYKSDFYILVYDTRKLRSVREDEIDKYLTTNHAFVPKGNFKMQDALSKVLHFKVN